MSIFIFPF